MEAYSKRRLQSHTGAGAPVSSLIPWIQPRAENWGYFDVDKLKDTEWIPNPTEGLNVDLELKDLLKDLIMDHCSGASSSEIASGKGEGLIFLLYGPPGCGKTLTAGEYPLSHY